ncbi:uncharacterized protein LOC111810184 isoform X1 [Cucurbita pepo subsp. pepo]|uniref:uncharacterized protein LOC111810184 isoform X1 n=1 Tax=Cucurbita pepo subsp. pepo TaxID=3664 RepID=UPI000C9D2F5A|nr:uncharacterized protein LOC111810184 isoform X1 [Cucurbita pepo subsp. pepo]
MESHVQFSETKPFWTNEKHMHFLNSMEASFVRSMFKNRNHRRLLRLDRHLSDTADSTLDSPHKNRKKHSISVGTRMDGRSSRRSRRIPSLPHTSIQDQVVPQMEERAVEDEDERDHPMSPVN